MKFTRDVRTPADPQDFESLYDRPARPPRDFRVTKNAGNTLCIFEFQDFSSPPDREPTVEYRAYFVPDSVATAAEIGDPRKRKSAIRLGRLACSATTSGRGEWIKLSSPDFAGLKGWYMACGVNRRGNESEPTLAYASPYN